MYLSSGFNETGPTIKEYIPGGGGGVIYQVVIVKQQESILFLKMIMNLLAYSGPVALNYEKEVLREELDYSGWVSEMNMSLL